jgi:hypothetical protein
MNRTTNGTDSGGLLYDPKKVLSIDFWRGPMPGKWDKIAIAHRIAGVGKAYRHKQDIDLKGQAVYYIGNMPAPQTLAVWKQAAVDYRWHHDVHYGRVVATILEIERLEADRDGK